MDIEMKVDTFFVYLQVKTSSWEEGKPKERIHVFLKHLYEYKLL